MSLEQTNRLDALLRRYKDVFSETLGRLKGPPVKVHLKPDATPVFARAREILLALRDTYIKEIDKKLASEFYRKVEHSEWASTTHIVMKKTAR